jgi:hypothetical protein
MNRSLLFSFAVLHLIMLQAAAHPVAQGAMEVVVGPDSVTVRARVSAEEVYVAEAFGPTNNAGTLDDVWQRHGNYILGHFHLMADGLPLAGQIRGITPPAKNASLDQVTYDLTFEFPAGRQCPRSIMLKQSILNEFSFAPGNRWEATYILHIAQSNQTPGEGLLFTSREPLTFGFRWDESPDGTLAGPTNGAMASAFIRHGVRHILSGYDHLLFVAGLVLAVVSLWDLVKVVTAFTLAHTITLTLAVLDVVRLSNRIVEPMIAASIVFIALQNLIFHSRRRDRVRLAVAFGFGLFHGLGFAGGLLSAMEGMRSVAIVTAIVAFSLGVEIGHQVVALPLFAVLQLGRSYARHAADPELIPRWITRMGSSAICAAGLAYLIAALR